MKTLIGLLLAASIVPDYAPLSEIADEPPSTKAAQSTPPIEVTLTRAEVNEDVLWLARALYSETKKRDEMYYVAWVIRNRVETRYRGATTYKQVVLDAKQFSGFNYGHPLRNHHISIDESFAHPAWLAALDVARQVYTAPTGQRPFALTVRHFYSPVAIAYAPSWAKDKEPVLTTGSSYTPHARFAFYDGVK